MDRGFGDSDGTRVRGGGLATSGQAKYRRIYSYFCVSDNVAPAVTGNLPHPPKQKSPNSCYEIFPSLFSPSSRALRAD